jgi:hypothetical protein
MPNHSSHSTSYYAIVFLLASSHGRRESIELRVDRFPSHPSEVEMPDGAYAFRYAKVAEGAHVESDGTSILMHGSSPRSKLIYSGISVYTLAQLRAEFPGDEDLIHLAEHTSTGKLVKLPGGGWEPLIQDAEVVNEVVRSTAPSLPSLAPFAGNRPILQ